MPPMLPLLRRLHRWAGLALALPMIVAGASGCILAAAPLLDCCDATSLATQVTPDPAMRIPAIFAAAAMAAPPGFVARRYQGNSGGSALVEFAPPRVQMPSLRVVVDPASLRVLSAREIHGGFLRWVRDLHESLLLGPQWRNIVGWSGLGLLFLGLSGVPLWWPRGTRWKAALTVSRGTTGLRFQRELHGAAGSWALALLLVQSISGAALAFPQTALALAGLPPLQQGGPRREQAQTPIDATPVLGTAVAAAIRAVPNAVLHEIRLPASAGRPVAAFLLPQGQWEGAPDAVVFLDPATGQIRTVQDPRSQGWGGWLLGWLRSLHYGGGLGLPWRLAIVAAGLVLPLFPVTGIGMWLFRRRNRRRIAARRQAAVMSAAQ